MPPFAPGGPREEKRARSRYLEELADAVVDWMEQNAPRVTTGSGLPRQEAAAYMLSVVGTLTQLAANMTQTLPSTGIAMNEQQFVDLARARFRVARETHGPAHIEPVEVV